MIRTQISLDPIEYKLAKKQAKAEGISVAELIRRSLRSSLPVNREAPWMRYIGMVESGDPASSQTVDEIVYGFKIEAYVDTGALIAALDRSDTHHSAYARLFSAPPPLITSSLVIAEGHGWFLRRYDQRKAIQFLSFIRELTPLRIIAFSETEMKTVVPLLTEFSDQRLTLADTHGLLLMKEHRIKACWSTDHHLGLTGVRLVN